VIPPRDGSALAGAPAVSVEHLAKSYGETVAVRDVSFEVQRGEVFALLGPNGAGKTTTVEILEGFRTRSSGNVLTLGVDPADRSTQRWLRTHIGVILQELAVEPYYSVRQVLTRNAGYYPNPRPVEEVAELIGLGEKIDERVKRLSGGQQRRLDVGLGIIGHPDLLFLDEPTTGLDPSGRRETWDLIHRLAAAGTTVLLTTHYMDEVEALADRVAVLFGQEIVASGTPASIGGRDLGAVTIRFRLPEGVALDALPAFGDRVEPVGDGFVEIHTEDEVRLLHELTGWALAGGHPLPGLSVLPVSLEDVYLGLTHGLGSGADPDLGAESGAPGEAATAAAGATTPAPRDAP
jgi:ABC-2 type transport system ATP-binding protein